MGRLIELGAAPRPNQILGWEFPGRSLGVDKESKSASRFDELAKPRATVLV